MNQKQIDNALTEYYWPPNLKANEAYTTTHDDHDGEPSSGFISLIFDDYGDAHLSIIGHYLRYRTIGGGGQFPKIRNALLLLADAIRQEGLAEGCGKVESQATNSVSREMPDVNTLRKMLVATGEISEFGLDTNGADRIIKLCHDVLARHFGR